jgi:hypothetical protein
VADGGSYVAMGLSTRPLTIYTSGGVEKVPEVQAKVIPGIPRLSRRREGVIKRKEDGTVEVVYPDSDEEEPMEVIPDEHEDTTVVKGTTTI